MFLKKNLFQKGGKKSFKSALPVLLRIEGLEECRQCLCPLKPEENHFPPASLPDSALGSFPFRGESQGNSHFKNIIQS